MYSTVVYYFHCLLLELWAHKNSIEKHINANKISLLKLARGTSVFVHSIIAFSLFSHSESVLDDCYLRRAFETKEKRLKRIWSVQWIALGMAYKQRKITPVTQRHRTNTYLIWPLFWEKITKGMFISSAASRCICQTYIEFGVESGVG